MEEFDKSMSIFGHIILIDFFVKYTYKTSKGALQMQRVE
jgi:hypothetical protein